MEEKQALSVIWLFFFSLLGHQLPLMWLLHISLQILQHQTFSCNRCNSCILSSQTLAFQPIPDHEFHKLTTCNLQEKKLYQHKMYLCSSCSTWGACLSMPSIVRTELAEPTSPQMKNLSDWESELIIIMAKLVVLPEKHQCDIFLKIVQFHWPALTRGKPP